MIFARKFWEYEGQCRASLDNFKPVNDSYGHEVGDQLLIEVAQRIRANIREEDTVSRQGGDEFALLLGDISSFSHCGQMLKRLHQALAQPYVIDDLTVDIGASSGITFYPLDEGDIDTLLRHADQAMYQAKLAGKNRYHFFNTEQDQKTINTNTRSQEIQQGFEEGELCLYYQPKVNMKTGDVFGAEALIRWIHPEKGMIPPLEFLPSIEDSDLEIEIGQWVITEAIKQLDEWMKHGITIEISVNVSSYHLLSDTFFAHLSDALEQYPEIPSHYLQLEILESSALGDLKTVSAVIKTCRDVLGVNIALDDFGTGYSSLTHLRNLPANTIKIDQSFVRDMLDDPSDYAIIDGVIGLAESFHRDVIAEGVETTEHGLMLLLLGCHNAQGYGIARPMPASDIPLWLETYVPNKEWTKCAAQQRTVKENKIKLLMVMLEYWFHHIEDAFLSRKSNDELGVFVDYRKSNLRSWVERARQEYLFDKEWLDSLALENEKMHQLANSLCIQHKEGVNKGSSADLVELEQAYKRVTTIIANQ